MTRISKQISRQKYILQCIAAVFGTVISVAAYGNVAEIEGSGSAEIVGGNVVSAKARALRMAKRNSLNEAIVTATRWLSREMLDKHAKAAMIARPDVYLIGYRVVDEGVTDAHYNVMIAARWDLKTLRRHGAVTASAHANAVHDTKVVAVSIASCGEVGGGLDAIRAKQCFGVVQMLIGMLKKLQIAAVPLTKRVRSEANTVSSGPAISIFVRVDDADGVRGLELLGGRATVSLHASTNNLEASGTGWGWGAERYDAQRRAVATACEEAFEHFVQTSGFQQWQAAVKSVALKVQAIGRTTPDNRHSEASTGVRRDISVALSGMTKLTQPNAICAWLQSHSVSVVGCVLKKLGPNGMARLSVATNRLPAKTIAEMLSAFSDANFAVRVRRFDANAVFATIASDIEASVSGDAAVSGELEVPQ